MHVYRMLGMHFVPLLPQMCVFPSNELVVQYRLLPSAKLRHRAVHGLAILYSQEISSQSTAL